MIDKKQMSLYLAPLEGITTFVYRNAMHRLFPDYIDKYFIPFIMPHIKRDMNAKEIRELCCENNKDINAVPQLLTNSAQDFLRYEKIFSDMGYDEINLNLGCPSGTVTAKSRGAGFLAKKQMLYEFLEEVFTKSIGRKISIKTRIGVDNTDEFYELLEIYNKYPIYELTIHPRLLREQYKGMPHREIFLYAIENSKNALVYNGDIWCRGDFEHLKESLYRDKKDELRLMIGRGAIADPAIFREISGGEAITGEELSWLLYEVERGYFSFLSNETQVLFRLKEMWTWLNRTINGDKRYYKKLLKAKTLSEFRSIQKCLIGES